MGGGCGRSNENERLREEDEAALGCVVDGEGNGAQARHRYVCNRRV
jgi:hypothetical protein